METQFTTAVSAAAATTASRHNSKFAALVHQAYEAPNKPQGYNGTVASLIWGGFARMSKTHNVWRRATLKSIFLHLYSEGCFKVLRSPVYVDVLINISAFGLKMIRPIEMWKRPSFNPDEQLEDFIDHLFAKYPTPVFLITAFYDSSLSKMLWYIKLGQGASFKELAGFPEHLTAKMVYYFRETPRGYSIPQAFVRAQAIDYGATMQIADRLAYSPLHEIEGNARFWGSAIQFFAKAEMQELWHLNTIISYLEFALQRDRKYAIKGRTMNSLTRDAVAWNAYTLKMQANASQVMWYSAMIPPLRLEKVQSGSSVRYETVELLNADDLYEEGELMNHCVADYVDDCAAGNAAIFSLRKVDQGIVKRLATIQIDPHNKSLVEARGNSNMELTQEAFAVLKTWLAKVQVEGWWDQYQVTREPVGPIANDPEPRRTKETPSLFIFWIIWMIIKMILIIS